MNPILFYENFLKNDSNTIWTEDFLKMAKYIDLADDDVKDLRGRIRKMVRDVDRCISMLKVE